MPTAAAWRPSTVASTPPVVALGAAVTHLARQALVRELQLTPKPGLVDQANSGAHRDMDLALFQASVVAITPWFSVFFQEGAAQQGLPPVPFLAHIRPHGLACEHAMLRATHGVNTHKGALFAIGLLCAAAGRLVGRGQSLTESLVCDEVAAICAGLVERELRADSTACSAAQGLYALHGLSGARGEAQNGFATARAHGVAPYRAVLAIGHSEERALLEALLHLMAHNPDTNLVSRGGLQALDWVQAQARELLVGPLPTDPDRHCQLRALDQQMIARGLSPGGSADLLAVSWFLVHLQPRQPWPDVGV